MAARLTELRSLYRITRQSIDSADPEKRAPLIARAESLLVQIEQLAGAATKKTGDPLDEIAARRAARGSASAHPGRASKQS